MTSRTTLSICLPPALRINKKEHSFQIGEAQYFTLDIEKLIDDFSYVTKSVESRLDELSFDSLMLICDWLYFWYKKNNHYILSNRILDSFRTVLSFANSKRKTTNQ